MLTSGLAVKHKQVLLHRPWNGDRAGYAGRPRFLGGSERIFSAELKILHPDMNGESAPRGGNADSGILAGLDNPRPQPRAPWRGSRSPVGASTIPRRCRKEKAQLRSATSKRRRQKQGAGAVHAPRQPTEGTRPSIPDADRVVGRTHRRCGFRGLVIAGFNHQRDRASSPDAVAPASVAAASIAVRRRRRAPSATRRKSGVAGSDHDSRCRSPTEDRARQFR
jgi:hypothetical protein